MSLPSSNCVDEYAAAVVAGAVPAGKYHRLSCERHLKDRRREGTSDFPYRFDYARAERFFNFSRKLKHYKGEWAGQFIDLQPYQRFRLGCIFGWVHIGTGFRRFKNAYNELPRKQGKSLEAAVVALYVTFYDGEPGAEGYCAATKRDQASIVFNDCKKLVQATTLKDRIKVQVSNLNRDDTASKLEPLGADHDSTDGLNPNFVCIDELHAHKTRGLIDVLETATGARRQPLVFKITTAGDDQISPGGDEHDYACQVLDGALADETYFAFIAHADPEDDWALVETAMKANPNFGVSVNPDDLASKVVKAKGMPSAAATYKQKHLNLWVNASAPWLSMEGWVNGQTSSWTAEDMLHMPCWIGIDLSSKLDLTALMVLFQPTTDRPSWRALRWAWLPEHNLVERGRRDRAPYALWKEQGHLLTVPGTSIDTRVVRKTVVALRSQFNILGIGFDPWHADRLKGELVEEDEFDEEQVLDVGQNFRSMSVPSKRLEADVLAGLFDVRGCPLTAWCASNAIKKEDGNGNIMPAKKRSRGRIDPIVASIIAMSMAIREPLPGEAQQGELMVV